MVAIEDNTIIHLTRGDITTGELNRLAFYLPVSDGEIETNYEFKPTDKISFVVFPKKGYTKNEIFRLDYTVEELGYTEPTTVVEIPLTEELTSKFPLLNKKATYWYDIALNETTTILGMDDEGAKKIIVYPAEAEGGK
jgi:hypothetical protein